MGREWLPAVGWQQLPVRAAAASLTAAVAAGWGWRVGWAAGKRGSAAGEGWPPVLERAAAGQLRPPWVVAGCPLTPRPRLPPSHCCHPLPLLVLVGCLALGMAAAEPLLRAAAGCRRRPHLPLAEAGCLMAPPHLLAAVGWLLPLLLRVAAGLWLHPLLAAAGCLPLAALLPAAVGWLLPPPLLSRVAAGCSLRCCWAAAGCLLHPPWAVGLPAHHCPVELAGVGCWTH